MNGMIVTVDKACTYPTPNGLSYKAKGAYRQGKFIIVVGRLDDDPNTIRLKYPAKDIKLKLF